MFRKKDGHKMHAKIATKIPCLKRQDFTMLTFAIQNQMG